ncbi:MAG TPA: hypothetical protein VF575_04020 [Candidatus Saccharimonadales bacterium]|jgi:hypothetical protein
MDPREIDTLIMECAKSLAVAHDKRDLYQKIVNTPFMYKRETTLLGLGIIVLLLKNDDQHTLDRVALSRTERAQGAVQISVKKFEDIRIPLDAKENILIHALDTDEFKMITDWKYMFIPALTAQEARLNQAGAAIDCSVVYPLSRLPGGGVMIFSFFEPMSTLTGLHHRFMRSYADACTTALNVLK